MRRFRCAHCLADLGPEEGAEEQPHCPDHPDGAVDIIEVDDGDS